MIAALLPVETFELGCKDADEHVLVLQMVLAEAKLDVLQIGQQNQEEFERRVHREFPEQDWRRAKGEAQADFSNLELLDVNLLDVSLCVHVRLSFLFHLIECTLYLSNFISDIGK